MPNQEWFDQQRRVTEARMTLFQAVGNSEERDVSIWLAAFTEGLKRLSDWNLEAELDQNRADEALADD